jgi:hypothetical protein
MTEKIELKLAAAIDRHALATERQTVVTERLARAVEDQIRMLEVFIEVMPATKEAEILGVSERTIRRRRKTRKNNRLLSAV